MNRGPNNNLAVLREDRIDVYVRSKLTRTVRLTYTDVHLIGWIGGRLIYRDGKDLRSFDIQTGKDVRFIGNDNVVRIHSLPHGYLGVEQNGDRVGVTRYDQFGKRQHVWSASGWYSRGLVPLVVGKYAVMEIRKIERGSVDLSSPGYLWVLDLDDGTQRKSNIGRNLGFRPGRTDHEILVAIPANSAESSNDLPKQSRIMSLDLADMHHRTVREGNGQVNIIGVSPDGSWLVALRPYAPVGPSELIALHLPDDETCVLRKNVYECILDSPKE